jgi:regulator of replication initiation timing
MASPQASGSEELRQPKVDGFKIAGELTGSIERMADIFRTITFIEVAQEKSAINLAYVESRDINKNPYLFSIIKFREDEIEVIYSIPPEISPTKRRMDVIRYLLNLFSLVSSEYKVDDKVLYQLVDDAIKKVTESVSIDYSKLYTEYDSFKKENTDLKKKIERFAQQNDALMNQNYELKAENDEIKLRLKELEKVSDDTLRVKIQAWISEHSGSINISEFSKVYAVSETRVEEMLNQLVSEGYLEAVR